jgi:dynein heavy chain
VFRFEVLKKIKENRFLASAELIHWKQRMATFNNLLEQIKSPRCRAVVGVLQIVKSKSIIRWKDLVC